jgi:hypothetical protein
MAICYHSNGPTLITVCGSALGYSTAEGVTLSITEGFEDINTDLWGPFVPTLVIREGSLAKVTFDLAIFDSAVLNTYMAAREGGVLGQEGIIGEPMYGGCSGSTRTCAMSLASPNDGTVYNFPITYIDAAADVTLSTQQKIWSLVIRCVPNTSSGVLYTITSS